MVQVTNTKTSEVKQYDGRMMVAPNGVIFIKKGQKTVFASGSTDLICEEV